MKLSSTLLLLASIAAPAFADISHPEVAAKLLRSARRLEAEGGEQQQDEAAGQEAGEQQQQDQQQQQAYEEEQWTQQINDRFSSAKMEGQVWPQNTDYDTDFNFLWKYSLKMISCQSDVPVLRENGSYDNNSVVLRLCPHDKGGCNSNKQMGCSRGYGDFVVSLETYMSGKLLAYVWYLLSLDGGIRYIICTVSAFKAFIAEATINSLSSSYLILYSFCLSLLRRQGTVSANVHAGGRSIQRRCRLRFCYL